MVVIFSTKGFAFPAFLTAYHMVVAIIGTNILRITTNLLPEAENPVPRRIWTHAIVPIGLLYSFSLVLSNATYVHLSVSLVQMMKASLEHDTRNMGTDASGVHSCTRAPDLVRGRNRPGMNTITAVILLMVGSGCVIASTGRMRYNLLGLACQSRAVVADASRLVVVQVLLRDIKMNPLLRLYYYAPVCLAAIALAFPFLEGTRPFYALSILGWPILLGNGLMSFALNVSSVLLIRSSGSVVSTLSGVLKDIILIFLSVVLLGSEVWRQQVIGYGIAVVGLIMFRNREHLVRWFQNFKSRAVGTRV